MDEDHELEMRNIFIFGGIALCDNDHQASDNRNLSRKNAPTDRGCQGKTPPDADKTGPEPNGRRSEEMLS